MRRTVLVSVAQQFVGAILNRVRDVRVGRTAICQVVFEAAVSRRIVRRSDDNAIGKALRATLVVRKDGARNDRRRREAVVALDESLHAVRSEHLERNAFSGTGEGVGVFAHEEGTRYPLIVSIFADRLRDGEDVRLGECRV